MTCTLINLSTRERTELPERPRGYDPFERAYMAHVKLWSAQCRLAAEFAQALFAPQKPCDSE